MNGSQTFETRVLPHLDAAYNLARWLLRDDHAADDAVQDALMRAMRYIASLREDEARAWLMGIVRNTCFSILEKLRKGPEWVEFDEEMFDASVHASGMAGSDPAAHLQRLRTKSCVDAAIRALSPPLREVIVLRELEGLDYAEIAVIAGVPLGTVMSRLSRARDRLRDALSPSRLDT